jgi:hypothetical protein
VLPLVLAALLAAALGFQLMAVDDIELPPAGPVTGVRGRVVAASDLEWATGGAVVLARSMFAPRAMRAADPPAAAAAPEGVMIVGSVQVGRATFAVVQGPGNRTFTVPIGGRVGAWRLRAVRGTAALLVRGGEKAIVPFGAREPLSTAAAATGNQ